jgi:hypothetical protein
LDGAGILTTVLRQNLPWIGFSDPVSRPQASCDGPKLVPCEVVFYGLATSQFPLATKANAPGVSRLVFHGPFESRSVCLGFPNGFPSGRLRYYILSRSSKLVSSTVLRPSPEPRGWTLNLSIPSRSRSWHLSIARKAGSDHYTR